MVSDKKIRGGGLHSRRGCGMIIQLYRPHGCGVTFLLVGREFSVSPLLVILTIIQVLASLFLIADVLLQSGKAAGLSGAIAGGVDTFMSRNNAKGLDAKLAKATKWVAGVFILITFIMNLV